MERMYATENAFLMTEKNYTKQQHVLHFERGNWSSENEQQFLRDMDTLKTAPVTEVALIPTDVLGADLREPFEGHTPHACFPTY